VHCGNESWTGSGWDVRLQAVVGQDIEDEDVEWIKGSSWCVIVMLSSPQELYRYLSAPEFSRTTTVNLYVHDFCDAVSREPFLSSLD